MDQSNHDFSSLVNIMTELREKCPWDRKQTIHSLRQMTLEESYELTDAVSSTNWQGIKEELGDLLLHIVFYSQIAKEQNQFTIGDVIQGITQKLITRHPHIYGDVEVNNAEDVKRNWEDIKIKEGKTSALSGLPKALPSLLKSMRLQEKAKAVGFEWDNTEQVWEKIREEENELHEAISKDDPSRIEDEFGDYLFSLVNLARFLKVDADNALERTNQKFQKRFVAMEQAAREKGTELKSLSLEEMDRIWMEVKKSQG